jgi:hypothetical protein
MVKKDKCEFGIKMFIKYIVKRISIINAYWKEINNSKTSLSNLFGGKVGRGCFPKIEFLELREKGWDYESV